MNHRPTFFPGLLVGMMVVVIIGIGMAISGVMPMKASDHPNILDGMGHMMWESSLFWRAPREKNPFGDGPAAVAAGFEHYMAMCVQCHGTPNVRRADWANGMLPIPPDLTASETQHRSDGELFYIIQHGVKMTGMPAFGQDHSPDDLWHIVAFMRNLSGLTEDQEKQLREAAGLQGHGHQPSKEVHDSGGHHH